MIARDNVDLGAAALGREFPVDPGTHVLTVRAPGLDETRTVVTLAEGESKVLELAPAVPAAVTPIPPTADKPTADKPKTDTTSAPAKPPVEQGSDTRLVGYVVGGAGALVLGAGAVTGILAFDRASTFKQHCDATGCDPTGLDAASSGKTLSTVSTVGFIAGAALIGVGAYFVLTSSPQTSIHASAGAGSGSVGLVRTF